LVINTDLPLSHSLFVHPSELRPNPWNSNHVGPENEAKLDEALKRLKFFKPIVVRETDEGYEIIGGEHRWRSAVRLGFEEVPIFNLGPIDDKKAKEISIADNARYGADDSISFAQVLSDIGDISEIQSFLPYSDTDLRSVFASVDIALDELEFDETAPETKEIDEPKTAKAPKTHTVMRFRLSNEDAERLTALIEKVKKRQGFTSSDDLTNAGDALSYLVFNEGTDADS
jgi:hypothetical protein